MPPCGIARAMSLETRNTPVPITEPTVIDTPSHVVNLRSSSAKCTAV